MKSKAIIGEHKPPNGKDVKFIKVILTDDLPANEFEALRGYIETAAKEWIEAQGVKPEPSTPERYRYEARKVAERITGEMGDKLTDELMKRKEFNPDEKVQL